MAPLWKCHKRSDGRQHIASHSESMSIYSLVHDSKLRIKSERGCEATSQQLTYQLNLSAGACVHAKPVRSWGMSKGLLLSNHSKQKPGKFEFSPCILKLAQCMKCLHKHLCFQRNPECCLVRSKVNTVIQMCFALLFGKLKLNEVSQSRSDMAY